MGILILWFLCIGTGMKKRHYLFSNSDDMLLIGEYCK
jgi:hypothetical protein